MPDQSAWVDLLRAARKTALVQDGMNAFCYFFNFTLSHNYSSLKE